MAIDREKAKIALSSLIGVDLHKVAMAHAVTVERDGKQNKGWAGHALERFLGLPINSAQSPNFGSWELKCVAAKTQNGRIQIKETMAITMIDPYHVKNAEFLDSHLYTKIRRMLIVVRLVEKNFRLPSPVLKIIEIDPNNNVMETIRGDYDLVRRSILENGFESLSGRMGQIVQPRTKGRGHGSTTRAFYFRRKFLQELYDQN